jgi:hypothetical protein
MAARSTTHQRAIARAAMRAKTGAATVPPDGCSPAGDWTPTKTT